MILNLFHTAYIRKWRVLHLPPHSHHVNSKRTPTRHDCSASHLHSQRCLSHCITRYFYSKVSIYLFPPPSSRFLHKAMNMIFYSNAHLDSFLSFSLIFAESQSIETKHQLIANLYQMQQEKKHGIGNSPQTAMTFIARLSSFCRYFS